MVSVGDTSWSNRYGSTRLVTTTRRKLIIHRSCCPRRVERWKVSSEVAETCSEAPLLTFVPWSAGCVRSYPILPRIVYIGMYIAVTITPMTPPRNTIIKGSSSFIKPATAVSTSSS